jgi:hypothetical protein
MARLRVLGRPTAQARTTLAERFLSLLPESQLADLLESAGLPPAEAARRAEAVRRPGARAGLDVLDGLAPEARGLFRL